MIVTLKITTFGISFKSKQLKLDKFPFYTTVEKFEKFEKLKELLELKAPCVKIQKPQYGVFFILI